jgi:hypothetical protein
MGRQHVPYTFLEELELRSIRFVLGSAGGAS